MSPKWIIYSNAVEVLKLSKSHFDSITPESRWITAQKNGQHWGNSALRKRLGLRRRAVQLFDTFCYVPTPNGFEWKPNRFNTENILEASIHHTVASLSTCSVSSSKRKGKFHASNAMVDPRGQRVSNGNHKQHTLLILLEKEIVLQFDLFSRGRVSSFSRLLR